MDQEERSHSSETAVLISVDSIHYSSSTSLNCIRRGLVDLHGENESCKILHIRDYSVA